MCDALTLSAQQSGVDADKLYVQIGVAHEGTHLLTGAHGQKATVSTNEGGEAGAGQTGGSIHRALLGNAAFQIAVGILLPEGDRPHSLQRIGRDHNNVLSLLRHIHHGSGKGLPGSFKVCHA